MTNAVLSLVLLAAPTFGPPKDQVVGSGNSVTETRELAEFDEIEFRVAGDFKVTIAEKATPLEIDADDNILPLITTEVVDGRLIVDSTKPFKAKHSPDFKVSVASLNRLLVLGAGDMTVRGLDNYKFRLDINGSADVRLSGKSDELKIVVNGSGDVHAFELSARQTDISIAGSGDVRVSSSETLEVSIAGSGDVKYLGKPTVHKSIAGSGDVRRHKKRSSKKGHDKDHGHDHDHDKDQGHDDDDDHDHDHGH